MKTTVGQKIRKIRQAKELTQDNMAFELGITKGAYSKIESEKSNVSIKRLEEIAKVLEVGIIEFFKDTNPKVEETPLNYGFATKGDIEEIVKMIQALTKEMHTLKTHITEKGSAIGKKVNAKK